MVKRDNWLIAAGLLCGINAVLNIVSGNIHGMLGWTAAFICITSRLPGFDR